MFTEPEMVVKELTKCLPQKPGWALTLGWLCAETLAIVTVFPMWIPMTMATPIVFGMHEGWLINFVAITSACQISTFIAQWYLREPIREFIGQGDYPAVRRAMLVMEDRDTCLLLLTLFRFLCLPLFIKNYGLGSLQVPMWKLCLSSLPHALWMSTLFTSWAHPIGISLKRVDMDHDEWVLMDFVPCLVASVSSFVVALFAQRKYQKLMQADDLLASVPA